MLGYMAGSALALFALDLVLVVRGVTGSLDRHILLWAHGLRSNALSRIFQLITDTGGIGRAVPVILVALFLLLTHRRLELVMFLAAVGIGQSITYGVKAIVQRERPSLFEVAGLPNDASFPSGHALGSAILYGMLALWMWHHGYHIPAILLVVWALLVGFSRIYLGVHYPTDVFASLCLGVTVLATTVLVYQHLLGASAQ